MNWHLRKLIPLTIFTLSVTACAYFKDLASSLTVADDTPPAWLELRAASITKSGLLQVRVNEAEIWESGDDLGILVGQKLQIFIDGHPLIEGIFVLHVFGPPTYVYDNEGNILGAHNGWTDVVFAPSTTPGWHTATIRITSTSGRLFEYSWEFLVPQPTDTP